MKTFNKIFIALGVAATAFGFSSCVSDLDKEPTNPSETTDVSKNMDQVLTDIYLNFSTFGNNGQSPVMDFDGGMASFQRAMFIAEEIPTDEASWIWDPSSYGTIQYGMVLPSVDAVFGFYSRLMVNITLCNEFIAGVNNGSFAGSDVPQDRIDDYVRQAKVLRSACYYYMLSFYDKIPYADETTVLGSLPTQLPRAEVYEKVTSCLEEVIASYPANQKPYYGFVGLDAAESIAAKIYLNGEVFAGRADYDKCYQHCKNVIDRLGHGGYYGNGLARSYQSLFGANNKKYVLGNAESDCNEIIWSLIQDQTNLLSWSGATFLICGWLGSNGVEVTLGNPTQDPNLDNTTYETEDGSVRCYKYYADATEYAKAVETYKSQEVKDWQRTVSQTVNDIHYSFDPKLKGHISQQWFNAGGGWKCMVARRAFVEQFQWDDANISESRDLRVANWMTSKQGFTLNNKTLVGDDWGDNGYLAPKYTNWAFNDDGSINVEASPSPREQVGGDYAAIRLAEIYLTAAEAIVKGGGGSMQEACTYVNHLVKRAYGDHYDDADVVKYTSLTMDDIFKERTRELYQENCRRTDLIRWNRWCSGYTWQWKGNVKNGTNLPEYTKLYPIPTRVMVSSDFEQTTGYN